MKKHLPLIVGISLPFIMIVVVVLMVSVPRAFIHPEYSFLYTASSYVPCATKVDPVFDRQTGCEMTTYSIQDGKLTTKTETSNNGYAQKLYLYDMERDSSREISGEEAASYVLSNETRSPDGYEIEYQYGHSGIFEIFGGGYNNSRWIIKKGFGSKPLSVANSADNYYYGSSQISFLGWIIKK